MRLAQLLALIIFFGVFFLILLSQWDDTIRQQEEADAKQNQMYEEMYDAYR